MVILLAQVLKHMHSGQSFSITVVAADEQRGTGGHIMHFPYATIYNSNNPDDPTQTNSPQGNKTQSGREKGSGERKNPNHHANKTRNIYLPSERRIITIHIKLITRFNGKTVLL